MEVQIDRAAVVAANRATTTCFLDQDPPDALLPPGDCFALTAPAAPPDVARFTHVPVMHDDAMAWARADVVNGRLDPSRTTLLSHMRTGRRWGGLHEQMFACGP